MNMDAETKARLSDRIKAANAANSIIGLAIESVTGNEQYFWEVIRDEAIKHAPMKSQPVRGLEQMSTPQMKEFESTAMPFGIHKGKMIKYVPIEYLEWLINRNETDKFAEDLRRYIFTINTSNNQG